MIEKLNKRYLFKFTLLLSVLIQFGSGVIQMITLYITRHYTHEKIVKELLIMDLIVQMIEGTFYIWLMYNFNHVDNVTPKRYLDWIITTPTMLVTLVVYLIYLYYKEQGYDVNQLTLYSVIKDNSSNLSYILYLNWLMLLFGYLGETSTIRTLVGVTLGFIPFIAYYYIIYKHYANLTPSGLNMFWFFFTVWSIYGIAAMLPYYAKNSIYNILDVFAKNFFGLYLSYVILNSA
jgi:hypothetical protein